MYAKRLRKWIKALRSGKFRQTRCAYHGSRGGHCCLGVAQIVAGMPKTEGCDGLSDYYGLLSGNINKLVTLNDHGHRSFAYIADHIEKKILPGFLTN